MISAPLLYFAYAVGLSDYFVRANPWHRREPDICAAADGSTPTSTKGGVDRAHNLKKNAALLLFDLAGSLMRKKSTLEA